MSKRSKRLMSLFLVMVLVLGSTLVVNAKMARFTHLGYTASCNVSSAQYPAISTITTSPASPWGVATTIYVYGRSGIISSSKSNSSTGSSCTVKCGDIISMDHAAAEYYMASNFSNYLGSISE